MTDNAAPNTALRASDLTLQPGPPFTGNLTQITTGEWAGWYQWGQIDPFEETVGPFYVARDGSGILCGFRPGPGNRNTHGIVHGGAMMTFADFSLFMLGTGRTDSAQSAEITGVTATMNCEFLRPAQSGDLLIARGERTGGGRRLVFARGIISANGVPVLTFSGAIRLFKPDR